MARSAERAEEGQRFEREPRRWVSPKRLAEELDVHHKTVLVWIREGDLPAYTLRSGEYRIDRADLGAILAPRHGPRPRRGGVVPIQPDLTTPA
jgi:excisionase family DNA binding protein